MAAIRLTRLRPGRYQTLDGRFEVRSLYDPSGPAGLRVLRAKAGWWVTDRSGTHRPQRLASLDLCREEIGAMLAREEESRLLAMTCFHCGGPALPETYGFDPRCERHRDV